MNENTVNEDIISETPEAGIAPPASDAPSVEAPHQIDIEEAIAEAKKSEHRVIEADIGNLASRSMLISLKIRCWKGERVDRMVSKDVTNRAGAAETAARVVKSILPKENLADLDAIVYRARDRWRVHTLPWMDDGQRILPVEKYQEFVMLMQTVIDAYSRAADEMAKVYPKVVEEAKVRLGKLYKEEDFPAPEEVRDLYSMEIRATPVASSDDWRLDLDDATVQAIKKSTEHNTRAALKGSMVELLGRMNDRVMLLANKIGVYDDGAQDKLRSELIDGLKAVVKESELFNLAGDKEVQRIAREITNGLTCVTTRDLTQDAGLRDEVRGRAQSISKRISALGAAWNA